MMSSSNRQYQYSALTKVSTRSPSRDELLATADYYLRQEMYHLVIPIYVPFAKSGDGYAQQRLNQIAALKRGQIPTFEH